MKLISSVKIGNHVYQIRQVKDLKDDHAEYIGWNKFEELDIAIRENIPNTIKLEAIMHEVIHGILNDTVFYGHKNNEDITVSLTRPLLDFIADNPEFIKFIQKEVKHVRGIEPQKRTTNQRRTVRRPDSGIPLKSVEPDAEPTSEPEFKPRRRRRTAPTGD